MRIIPFSLGFISHFKAIVDWEQHKLGEVAEIIGGGTPSTSNKEYWDGDIDWYSPAEIGEQVYVYSSQKKITELGLQKSSAKILPIGTVLFTSRAGIGNTAILAKEGTTNQGFQSIIPLNDKLDSYFIYSRTLELKRYGETHGAGSTFVEVSGKQMAKMPIITPRLKEQKQIGNFFKQLDFLITLHQRKLDALKRLKEAYLQSMFPERGESVPKLRFTYFEGEWKQRKLGELTSMAEYGLNASAVKFDGTNKYIRITDIDEDTRIFSNRNLTSPNTDLSMADNYLLQSRDILFARTGASVGKTYLYEKKDGKVYYAGFLIRVRISNKYYPQFVFQYTLTDKYNNFVKITSQRSGQPGINANEYLKLSIMVPNLAEQTKIGNLLKKTDEMIALHLQKLEQLQNVKKAYLQKMFI